MIAGIVAGAPLVVVPPALSYYDEVMADSPVLYLRLAETSGDPVNSGSATLGSSSYGSTTKAQASLCGDLGDYSVLANSSYVTAASSSTLIPANGFTMECLINPANVSGLKAIMSGPGSGRPYIRLSNNQIEFLRSQVALVGTFSGTVSANTTAHLAVTVTAGGVTNFYLNGAASGTGSTFSSYPTTQTVYAGREAALYDNFAGYLDEIAVYHTALSAGRIAAHAAAAGF